MSRPDYLNKPEHERRLLSQPEETPAQKAEPDKLQLPLVRVAKRKKFIRAKITCDSCGAVTEDAKEYQLVIALKAGCFECGASVDSVRIVDEWE